MNNEDRQQRRILVADDDPDILAIVSAALAAQGYAVREARDGLSAYEACRAEVPDLAVLDLMMPGLSGTEVVQRIRELPGGDVVPIMMLTARDSVQDKVSALDLGADDYMTKPFNHNELLARVRALLRVRELNIMLSEKNRQLAAMQEKLLKQERELAVSQTAGAAAHQLGQPLSAMMLNIHLVETLPADDERVKIALVAIKQDLKRMGELLDKIRGTDGSKTRQYYGKTGILDIEE